MSGTSANEILFGLEEFDVNNKIDENKKYLNAKYLKMLCAVQNSLNIFD